MKHFPAEILQPKISFINAKIFKNDFLRIPATLFYTIEIDLEAIKYQNQKINTTIHIDFIKLDIYSLKELENRTFEFPINPENGFIDSSIYLFDVHNPVDVYKIEFGVIKNKSIEAIINFDIDFEYENTEFKKLTDLFFTLNLKFGELSIDTEIMNAQNFDEATITELASKFTDLTNYEKPILQNQQIIYKTL